MRNLPVHWSEGLFLRPQHFQAADRYWSAVIETSPRWDNDFNYGIRKVEISDEAVANYQLQVTTLHARLKDGTVITLDAGQEPDRVNLKNALQSQAEVTAYAALPKLSLGRANVGQSPADRDRRYVATDVSVQDESAGGNDQELQLRAPNVRILLSTDELSGFEVLPIARIQRAGDAEAVPRIDRNYFPPSLAIDAWQPLGSGVVRGIFDVIGQKVDVLSSRAAERGITLASQEPGDLDDLLMLNTLNGAAGVLSQFAFAGGVHPFWAYAELCRIVGQLSIFGPTKRPPEIPQYDHDDLARIFKWAKQQIEMLLGGARTLDYEQRYFVGTERGMEVSIDPKWLSSDWAWYIGVNVENISERECRDMLQPGQLDWKMGSAQQVDLIFKHGIPGITQTELMQAPRALPSRKGWIYYEVGRDNAAWKDVLATQTLAIRFKEELIHNLDRLQGQRTLEVAANGKRAVLQFALFAVPK